MQSIFKRPWPLFAVVSAVLIVVYMAADSGSNKRVDKIGSQPGHQPATNADEVGLNIGKMSTFIFHAEPRHLSEATFNDSNGNPLTIASFAGKTILLNLWATWCAPCRHEMPHLDRLQSELSGEKFEVVAVSIDRGSPQKSRRFLAEINARDLKLYHDPTAQIGFALNTFGMPSTLLIDEKGREIGRLVGPAEWDHADARRLIQAHLRKPQS